MADDPDARTLVIDYCVVKGLEPPIVSVSDETAEHAVVRVSIREGMGFRTGLGSGPTRDIAHTHASKDLLSQVLNGFTLLDVRDWVSSLMAKDKSRFPVTAQKGPLANGLTNAVPMELPAHFPPQEREREGPTGHMTEPTGLLQEYCQHHHLNFPLMEVTLDDTEKGITTVKLTLETGGIMHVTSATGASKKVARAMASEQLLLQLVPGMTLDDIKAELSESRRREQATRRQLGKGKGKSSGGGGGGSGSSGGNLQMLFPTLYSKGFPVPSPPTHLVESAELSGPLVPPVAASMPGMSGGLGRGKGRGRSTTAMSTTGGGMAGAGRGRSKGHAGPVMYPEAPFGREGFGSTLAPVYNTAGPDPEALQPPYATPTPEAVGDGAAPTAPLFAAARGLRSAFTHAPARRSSKGRATFKGSKSGAVQAGEPPHGRRKQGRGLAVMAPAHPAMDAPPLPSYPMPPPYPYGPPLPPPPPPPGYPLFPAPYPPYPPPPFPPPPPAMAMGAVPPLAQMPELMEEYPNEEEEEEAGEEMEGEEQGEAMQTMASCSVGATSSAPAAKRAERPLSTKYVPPPKLSHRPSFTMEEGSESGSEEGAEAGGDAAAGMVAQGYYLPPPPPPAGYDPYSYPAPYSYGPYGGYNPGAPQEPPYDVAYGPPMYPAYNGYPPYALSHYPYPGGGYGAPADYSPAANPYTPGYG